MSACLLLALNKQVVGRFSWLIVVHLALTLVAEITGGLLSLNAVPNGWVYNLNSATEFMLLTLIVTSGLSPGSKLRSRMWAAAVYLTMLIYNTWTHDPFVELLGLAYLTGGFVLVVFHAMALFREASLPEVHLFRSGAFWFNLSVVLYFGCCLPYVGLLDYLNEHDLALASRLYFLVDGLFFLRYGLAALSFVMLSNFKTRSS